MAVKKNTGGKAGAGGKSRAAGSKKGTGGHAGKAAKGKTPAVGTGAGKVTPVARETIRPGEGETLKRKDFVCPHCHKKMNKWQVPSFHFSDGLGWGTDHLYICFNDQCGFFTRSWGHMEEAFGQDMGYRCMCHPDSHEYMAIPAGSVDAMKGNILDEIQEARDAEAIERRKQAMSRLTDAYMATDIAAMIEILKNEEEWPSVQLKAVQLLGDMKDLAALEPLLNSAPANDIVRDAVRTAVRAIHDANFTRECPHCAEIIKQRATICKHCGNNVTA